MCFVREKIPLKKKKKKEETMGFDQLAAPFSSVALLKRGIERERRERKGWKEEEEEKRARGKAAEAMVARHPYLSSLSLSLSQDSANSCFVSFFSFIYFIFFLQLHATDPALCFCLFFFSFLIFDPLRCNRGLIYVGQYMTDIFVIKNLGNR